MSNPPYFPLTVAAYVAQLENDVRLSKKLAACTNCSSHGDDVVLRRCVGCRLAAYCSKECQKQHWSEHRTFCNMVQAKGKKDAYLSRLDQEECFRQLIDSYRVRVEEDHLQRHQHHGVHFTTPLEDGLVWANGDVYDDFQRYLDIAGDTGVLPDWWNFETRMECLAQAFDDSGEENVLNAADSQAIIRMYANDLTICSALHVLAELIVGYEGKGSTTDDSVRRFREYLGTHPEERDEIISKEALFQRLEGDM